MSRASDARASAERTAQAEATAYALFRTGMTFREVSQRMEWSSPQVARNAITRAINLGMDGFTPEESVALMVARCQDRRRVLYDVIATNHYCVSSSGMAGKVVDPVTGEETLLIDKAPNIRAVAELRKEDDFEAMLRDLRPAAKKRVEVITQDAVDAQIMELAKEIQAAGGVPVPFR